MDKNACFYNNLINQMPIFVQHTDMFAIHNNSMLNGYDRYRFKAYSFIFLSNFKSLYKIFTIKWWLCHESQSRVDNYCNLWFLNLFGVENVIKGLVSGEFYFLNSSESKKNSIFWTVTGRRGGGWTVIWWNF